MTGKSARYFCGSPAHALDRRGFVGAVAGGGAKLMMRGRRDEASLKYPDLGAVLARELGRADSQVPDYVSMYFSTEGRDFAPGVAGFLGSRYAPMELYKSMMPENIRKLDA